MYNRNKKTNKVITQQKKEQGNQLWQEKQERLKVIYTEFQNNLTQYATQYKEKIKKNPQFRSEFNQLCQGLGVDPMMSKKSMFSDLGFGDFYGELSTKVLDICAKKRRENGGIMKMQDICYDFKKIHKEVITSDDIKRSLKTIEHLGGVTIFKEEYVCTVPVEFSEDITDLMAIGEQEGYVSLSLMKRLKGWNEDRFQQKITVLQKEGLVWADKKTTNKEVLYYFPSMLNTYILNQDSFSNKLLNNLSKI